MFHGTSSTRYPLFRLASPRRDMSRIVLGSPPPWRLNAVELGNMKPASADVIQRHTHRASATHKVRSPEALSPAPFVNRRLDLHPRSASNWDPLVDGVTRV